MRNKSTSKLFIRKFVKQLSFSSSLSMVKVTIYCSLVSDSFLSCWRFFFQLIFNKLHNWLHLLIQFCFNNQHEYWLNQDTYSGYCLYINSHLLFLSFLFLFHQISGLVTKWLSSFLTFSTLNWVAIFFSSSSSNCSSI